MAGNLSGNLNGIVQFLSFDLCAKLRIFSEIHKKRMPKLLLTSLYSYLFTIQTMLLHHLKTYLTKAPSAQTLG